MTRHVLLRAAAGIACLGFLCHSNLALGASASPVGAAIRTSTSAFNQGSNPAQSATEPVDALFSDDFEGGDLKLWTTWTVVSGLVVQQSEVATGNGAARATSDGTSE